MKSTDMKRIEYVLAGLLLLCSCQEKIDYWMTGAATATMDRLVGEYALESIDWSLGAVDLDGDGVADPDFAKEIAAVRPGSGSYARLSVNMDGSERYMASIDWLGCAVADIEYFPGRSWQVVNWNTFNPGGRIELDEDGNYAVVSMASPVDYDEFSGKEERVYCMKNMEYAFEGTDCLIFRAETAVYDYATDSVQRGTVTYSFRCVSGKGMVRQAHQPWFGRAHQPWFDRLTNRTTRSLSL